MYRLIFNNMTQAFKTVNVF
ncbi:MAG: hypothetical protein KA981_11345 [Bacteroidia bacterium]|nr:hypothetical protein [Bacteroidia bacterium]